MNSLKCYNIILVHAVWYLSQFMQFKIIYHIQNEIYGLQNSWLVYNIILWYVINVYTVIEAMEKFYLKNVGVS